METSVLCNVGDLLYGIYKDVVITCQVDEIVTYPTHSVYRCHTTTNSKRTYFNHSFNKSIFYTQEDAKKEINKRKLVSKKRELMKEYEAKLNQELDIKDHFIIK